MALERLGRLAGRADYREVAWSSAEFIRGHLLADADGPYFAYVPGETAFVHNASLWGAAWCAVAGSRSAKPDLVDLALRVAHKSAAQQASDGSWIYGTRPHHRFIDAFHTGYNLEALKLICDHVEDSVLSKACEAGYRFYIERCFDEHATAKYYANGVYPIDMHSVAQAIVTIIKVAGDASALRFCDRILRRGVDLLYRPAPGLFAYQRSRLYANSLNYLRWTQAWAYYSLSLFLHHTAKANGNAS
jgi:hypothetical protein